jgi:hydroxypyruvate reductase 2
VDHVDLAGCARRGVIVAGAGKIFSVDVADHAVGLLIAVLRRVSAADRYVRAGLWPAQGDYPLTSKVRFLGIFLDVEQQDKNTIFFSLHSN